MSSMFDRKKVIRRYKVVAYAMLAVGLLILVMDYLIVAELLK